MRESIIRHYKNRTDEAKVRRFSCAAGFSFIDVMLALVILTFGVLALADFQVIASKANTSSKSLTAAINVAEQKLEAIRGMVYANIAAEAPTPVASSGINFTRQVTVVKDSPIAHTTTVTVTVQWADNLRTHTIPITAIVAQ